MKKLLSISSVMLIFPAVAYSNEIVGIQELKEAMVFMLQDIENLEKKVKFSKNKLTCCKKKTKT